MLRDPRGLFRTEALDHYTASSKPRGEVLHLLPRWIRWCYPVVIGIVGTGLILAVSTHVPLYASGPSIIQVTGRSDVVSPVAGIVESILVAPGDPLHSGQALVLLNASEQKAEYERVRKEFEDQLVNHLRDLLDPTASQQVASLRSELAFAERMRDLRCLRAPFGGKVADVRVQVGQEILPGQVAVTFRSGAVKGNVLAAIPGRFRPMLGAGDPAWLHVEGFPDDRQRVTVTQVGTGVIGPKEAARYLGATVAGSMPLDGPVVLIRTTLPETTFSSSGRSYSYHDGMAGRLEIQVQTEPMIVTLVPGLRSLSRAANQ